MAGKTLALRGPRCTALLSVLFFIDIGSFITIELPVKHLHGKKVELSCIMLSCIMLFYRSTYLDNTQITLQHAMATPPCKKLGFLFQMLG